MKNVKRRTEEYHVKRAVARKQKKEKCKASSLDGNTEDAHSEIEMHQEKRDVYRKDPFHLLGGI